MSEPRRMLGSTGFRVTDHRAFATWFASYDFGENVKVTVLDYDPDTSAEVRIQGTEQRGHVYPAKRVANADEGDETEPGNLASFATECAGHLLDGEIAFLVSMGPDPEAPDTVTGWTLAITTDRWAVRFTASDCYRDAEQLLAEDGRDIGDD